MFAFTSYIFQERQLSKSQPGAGHNKRPKGSIFQIRSARVIFCVHVRHVFTWAFLKKVFGHTVTVYESKKRHRTCRLPRGISTRKWGSDELTLVKPLRSLAGHDSFFGTLWDRHLARMHPGNVGSWIVALAILPFWGFWWQLSLSKFSRKINDENLGPPTGLFGLLWASWKGGQLNRRMFFIIFDLQRMFATREADPRGWQHLGLGLKFRNPTGRRMPRFWAAIAEPSIPWCLRPTEKRVLRHGAFAWHWCDRCCASWYSFLRETNLLVNGLALRVKPSIELTSSVLADLYAATCNPINCIPAINRSNVFFLWLPLKKRLMRQNVGAQTASCGVVILFCHNMNSQLVMGHESWNPLVLTLT